jgi:hypothetical protein
MRRRVLLSLVLFSVPFVVSAQEVPTGSGATTASGSVTIQETAELKALRNIRTKDFRSKMLAFSKIDASFRTHETAFRKKRAELRRNCREELRRANRDTKFPKTLQCFRSEMTLEKDFLQERSDWLAAMPGVPNTARSVAVSRLDVLRDAVDTVVLGIDGKVYVTIEDLLEARANLLAKYRTPFAESLTTARAETLLTWTQELILSLDSTLASDGSSLSEDGKASWAAARECLLKTEHALLNLHNADAAPTLIDLRSAFNEVSICKAMVSALPLVQPVRSDTTTTP